MIDEGGIGARSLMSATRMDRFFCDYGQFSFPVVYLAVRLSLVPFAGWSFSYSYLRFHFHHWQEHRCLAKAVNMAVQGSNNSA